MNKKMKGKNIIKIKEIKSKNPKNKVDRTEKKMDIETGDILYSNKTNEFYISIENFSVNEDEYYINLGKLYLESNHTHYLKNLNEIPIMFKKEFKKGEKKEFRTSTINSGLNSNISDNKKEFRVSTLNSSINLNIDKNKKNDSQNFDNNKNDFLNINYNNNEIKRDLRYFKKKF
jgi:hypothetical protein